MKYPVFGLVLLVLLISPLVSTQYAQDAVVPVEATVVAADGDPQAGLRRISRAERKLAREVIRDAAKAQGVSRLKFMRAVNRGEEAALDELKISLAAHEDAREIDIDRLREILQVILDFIKQLLALFGMFADTGVPIQYSTLMNVAPETVPDQAKPDQVRPDQVACRAPVRSGVKATGRAARRVGQGLNKIRPRLLPRNRRFCCSA